MKPLIASSLLMSSIFASLSATGAVIKNLEFDVDLSAEADIEKWSGSGDLSVSGGVLQQRTFGVSGNFSYFFPGFSAYIDGNGPAATLFQPDLPITLEARIEIQRVEGTAGLYAAAADGDFIYTLNFQPTGIGYGNMFATYADLFGAALPLSMHSYGFETTGDGSGAFDFYVDGSLIGSAMGASTVFNGFEFGDGISALGNGADADWDFLRVSQTAVSSIPEPASAMASALLMSMGLLLRGRRHAC